MQEKKKRDTCTPDQRVYYFGAMSIEWTCETSPEDLENIPFYVPG